MSTDKALFYPSLGYYQTVAHIPFADTSIISDRYRSLILDVDNTLAEPLHSHDVPDDITRVLQGLKWSGRIAQICLVSNMVVRGIRRRERRIDHIASMVGADFVVRAYWPRLKPHPYPFVCALELMRADKNEVIVIDDQIHTGIRGANICGLASIKVAPLGPDPLWTAWKRLKENRLMREMGLSLLN